jgi:hypothetical protein
MRYRGPIEYDKFVLNCLQFHNEINELVQRELNGSTVTNLLAMQKQVNDMYYKTIGSIDYKSIGFSESLYLKMLDMKEC